MALGILLLTGFSSPAGAVVPCPSAWKSLIASLSRAEESNVREAIRLTRHGEAELALLKLDNGRQGSLQVWTAWALLRLGNSLGAFGDDNCGRRPQRA